MTPTLRPMRPADLPEVLEIIRAHSRTDASLAERYFRRYYADPDRLSNPRESTVVAVVRDEVGGLATYGPDKYDWPGILWIEWLYVGPRYRKHGWGTALLEHVLTRARALDTRKIYLNTDSTPGYQAAIRLYSRFGFVEEGRLLDYYGTGYHSLLMGLDLRAWDRRPRSAG